MQRRRNRRADEALQEQQRLAHLARVAVVGELITVDDESARCQRVLDEGAVSWLREPVGGPQLIQCVEQG